MPLEHNRLTRVFAELGASGHKALVPFLTAGYPDLETTEALLVDVERRGARICELGIPFTDPIADGPTIQGSYTEALAAGVTSRAAFDMVRRYRQAGGEMALLAMVSYSIVFRRGAEAFLDAAKAAGLDGLIVPDLPLDEAERLGPPAAARELANVMLIAPTTPPARRLAIAAHSRGFIYFISVAGITGQRDRLPDETIAAVKELRSRTRTPVCVGFGISNPQTVATVCAAADGAIVGSAIIHRITEAKAAPREQLVERVGGFVGELLAAVP